MAGLRAWSMFRFTMASFQFSASTSSSSKSAMIRLSATFNAPAVMSAF